MMSMSEKEKHISDGKYRSGLYNSNKINNNNNTSSNNNAASVHLKNQSTDSIYDKDHQS